VLQEVGPLAGNTSLNLATIASAPQLKISSTCAMLQVEAGRLRRHSGGKEPTLASSVWCSRSRPGSDLMSTPVRACLCASAEVLCAFPLARLQQGACSASEGSFHAKKQTGAKGLAPGHLVLGRLLAKLFW